MRKLILTAIAAGVLASASIANATVFIGSTLGCFGPGCVVANTSSPPGSGITFDSGTFNQSDSNGFLAIGTGAPYADTLGLISLTNLPSFWVNVPFTLQVTFTSPAGTTPGSALYTALLNGSVSSDGSGGAFFDFNNTPQTFTFADSTFSLFVNDLGVSTGAVNTPLNGVIQVAAVPEAATWALMLMGFGGIGLAMRRRRRPVLAQLA